MTRFSPLRLSACAAALAISLPVFAAPVLNQPLVQEAPLRAHLAFLPTTYWKAAAPASAAARSRCATLRHRRPRSA
jgi:hypothetical protein